MNAITALPRIKRITSHVGVSDYFDSLLETNLVTPRIPEIPSPYAYSSVHTVYQDDKGRMVIVVETAHKRYDVFDVSHHSPLVQDMPEDASLPQVVR